MCNLCCVAMDGIKKKNYSVPNLRSCFADCSKSYNKTDGIKVGSSSDGSDTPQECNKPEDIDIKAINKEEKNVCINECNIFVYMVN